MKRIIITMVLSLLLFATPAYASSVDSGDWLESLENIVFEQLGELEINSWEPYLKYTREQGMDLFDGEPAKDIIKNMVTGRFSFGWQDVLDLATRVFLKELGVNLMLMAKIIILAVLCSILRNMNDSLENPSVGEIGYFVCYSVVIILVIQSMINILNAGRSSIELMSGFMQVLMPILLIFLTSLGSFASSSVLQPAIGVMTGVLGSILENIMLPLITLSTVVTLVNYISERVQIQKLSKLLNTICIWILTFVFTIFIGVLTIQGAVTSTFDGISIRTAKFALDTFVPIVGKMFSQSLDTIIGCSLLLKNAVGVAGLIILGILCILPGFKILSLMFLYKLSSALLEPITDKRIVECLNDIGSILTVFFITIMGIALMFFLTVTLIIGTGNTSVMLR